MPRKKPVKRPTTMTVWPASDAAKTLKHPRGMGLSESAEGTQWPMDQFTMRRIRDGDLTEEQPQKSGTRERAPRRSSGED